MDMNYGLWGFIISVVCLIVLIIFVLAPLV